MDSSSSDFYTDCLTKHIKNPEQCIEPLKSMLEKNKYIPSKNQKYFQSEIACRSTLPKYVAFLAVAVVSLIAGIATLSFGVAKKKKGFWISGIVLLFVSTVFFVLYTV